ncbi:uncharacterized protein [Drosophila virilis]|uniref:Uncharacterized protein n=1 Tax=Drosophila virilis TaxID=7244 RepID=B4M2Q9_DROVI|nr:uncharacterized protein LOC6632153 [Drosophila virilis]EDW65963.2 uncharacterized protein Dvir_GJ18602 [Drosophila virilis]
MENLALRRGANASCNFNNMTDEQLQAWHTAVLSEAQRENYVNHNLEIVRHYRTEAISRAPAFDLERNAIDAAIARHGLCVPHAVASSESIARTQAAAAAAAALAANQEEVQPPPIRRPRMEQPEEQQPNVTAAPSVSGTATATSSATAIGNRYGHYVALAHIFSDTYAARSAEPTVAASGAASANGGVSSTNNNNNSSSSTNKNQEPEEAEINDMAITKTIDSLGLRRT